MGVDDGAVLQQPYPAFRQRWPWHGPDLQTVRNSLPGAPPGVGPADGERVAVDLADGSGDRLAARVHRGNDGLPAVMLLPGLTGCDASPAVLQAARYWIGRGHAVVRLNMRGAPPGADMAHGLHHMDRVSDLADACKGVAARHSGIAGQGWVVMGFSLGGALALRLAARSARTSGIRAVIAVSAPVNLPAASTWLSRPRNRLYERWLLRRMIAQSRHVWMRMPPAVGRRLRSARSVREFDEVLVCGMAGYRNAATYYDACSPDREWSSIRLPTLLVHAADDPWVPPPPDRLPPAVSSRVAAGGGHVGFHGRGDRTAWHLRVSGRFLEGLGLSNAIRTGAGLAARGGR